MSSTSQIEVPTIFLSNLLRQTSSFLHNSSVNAQLLHPHKMILITVALYGQTCNFADIPLLHNTHLIVAKEPFS